MASPVSDDGQLAFVKIVTPLAVFHPGRPGLRGASSSRYVALRLLQTHIRQEGLRPRT
jgi:hypothetical protein